jgi:hypothetical protein
MQLHHKLAIGIIMASSLVSCVGHQDQENLSTKSPIVNTMQLSGYTKKDYTVKDITGDYYTYCSHDVNSIVNDAEVISTLACYKKDYYPYYYNILLTIDKENKYYDSNVIDNIKNIHSGFDPLRTNKNNIIIGLDNHSLEYYSYDFIKFQNAVTIKGDYISTSPDGNIGITLSYDTNQSLILSQFDAYTLSDVKPVLSIKGGKNDYNYLASKVVSNKAIVNVSTNPSVNKSTNGAFIYDVGSRRVHSISAIDDMEKLHFDVVYQDNMLIGVSQLPTKLPRLISISTLDTTSRKYVDMPNVTETSVVKIVDYSSKVMYYTVTDNGVTNGYFYNMQNQRFYEDNDVIQILTNYTMDDSKLSTVSLSQNDKYLLLDFKYDSVDPTTKPYITKIVFDDSFANFLNDKIIPIDKTN